MKSLIYSLFWSLVLSSPLQLISTNGQSSTSQAGLMQTLYASDVAQQQQYDSFMATNFSINVIDYFFDGEVRNLNKYLSAQFDLIPKQNRKFVKVEDVSKYYNHSGSRNSEWSQGDLDSIWSEFKLMDHNNDTKVTRREYVNYLSEKIPTEGAQVAPSVCLATEDRIRRMCLATVNANNNLDGLNLAVTVQRLKCFTGISSVFKYTAEKCVAQAQSCSAVQSCFEHYNLSNIPEDVLMRLPTLTGPPANDTMRVVGEHIAIGGYYAALLATSIAGFFIAFPYSLLTMIPTTTVGLTGMTIAIPHRVNTRIANKMALTKWDPTNDGFGIFDKIANKTNILAPNPPPPPKPECDVYLYWSQSCAAVSSPESRVCSDGGSLVVRDSCKTHFSAASKSCGKMQSYGCHSLCYNSELRSCTGKFNYMDIPCSAAIPDDLDPEINPILTVGSFRQCQQLCNESQQKNGTSCGAFTFIGSEWNEDTSKCILYDASRAPNMLSYPVATGCVFAAPK
ncbi:hypothetical protein MP228_005146 [Amoeboaphelidium protococcarum]|nr:hypothetical protein MP228_005146 [Amoeboaphelidium protococcarum]